MKIYPIFFAARATDTEIDPLAQELAQTQRPGPNPRRNGKIAGLPHASREMLNRSR